MRAELQQLKNKKLATSSRAEDREAAARAAQAMKDKEAALEAEAKAAHEAMLKEQEAREAELHLEQER